jgi:mRNA interferase MazF
VKRGELWTVAGGNDYAGKPRPALILQDDIFDRTDSVTICITTTTDVGSAAFRVPLLPTPETGLKVPCFLMVDKVTTVPRLKMGRRIGAVQPATMADVGRAIIVFLGLTG